MPRLLWRHLKVDADGEEIAVEPVDDERHGDAQDEADQDTDDAHQQDLHEEDA